MGSISKGICIELLDHIFGVGAYTPPTTVYVSLHTADPAETGASECTYTGYGTRPSTSFGAAASRKIIQAATPITFPQCTGTGNDATHYGLWTAATAGVFMGGGSLSSTLNIVSDNTPSIAASEIEVSFTAGGGTDGQTGIATYCVHKALDFLFRNQAFTAPTIKLALTTAVCTDAAIGTECSGNNYSRLAHSAWDAAVETGDTLGGRTENTGVATFATPSGTWGTVTAVAIMDGDTSNMLFYGNDVTNQAVGSGDTVQFADGALDVSVS